MTWRYLALPAIICHYIPLHTILRACGPQEAGARPIDHTRVAPLLPRRRSASRWTRSPTAKRPCPGPRADGAKCASPLDVHRALRRQARLRTTRRGWVLIDRFASRYSGAGVLLRAFERNPSINSSDGRCGHLCPAVPMLRARFKSVLHSPSPKSLPPHPSAYPSPKRLTLAQAPAPDPSVRSITRASVHSLAHTI